MRRLATLLILLVLAGCSTPPGPKAQFEEPSACIDAVASDLSRQLVGDQVVAVTQPVVDKSDLWSGDHKRIAAYPDRLLGALVRVRQTGSKQRYVTRARLTALLTEHGLRWADLDPTDAKTQAKLRAISDVQAYVVWRIRKGIDDYGFWYGLMNGTRYFEDWTLMVVSVQTGEVLAASVPHRLWLD